MFILERNGILLLVASCFCYHHTDPFLSIPLAAFVASLMSHLCPLSHLSQYPQYLARCLTHSKILVNIWEPELKNMKLQVIEVWSQDCLGICLS